MQNQIEILKHENKEQQKQIAESKVNIEMAIEKINNMDEEYSDKIKELSNTIDMEWKASHAQLSDKFVGLQTQISLLIASVHKNLLAQSKTDFQEEIHFYDNDLFDEHQHRVYNDEDFEKFKCDQCNS